MTSSGGRPPGPTDETRERVLQAAFRLLVTEGPAELTPVRIHRETGVARTTVYRHWPTPTQIVEEIMGRAVARDERDSLTGELAHDLRVAIGTLTFRFENRPVGAFYRATLEHGDPDETPSMSERYIAGLTDPVRDVIAASVERGEIVGDVEELTSALCGPLLLDHLLLARPVDHDAIEARIERILREHAR